MEGKDAHAEYTYNIRCAGNVHLMMHGCIKSIRHWARCLYVHVVFACCTIMFNGNSLVASKCKDAPLLCSHNQQIASPLDCWI